MALQGSSSTSLPSSALQRQEDKLHPKLWVPGLSPKTPETSTCANATPESISGLSGFTDCTSPQDVFSGVFPPNGSEPKSGFDEELTHNVPGWKLSVDEKGRAFHFNTPCRECSWSHSREAFQEELQIFVDGCHKASDVQRRAAARGFLEELSARAQRDLSSWSGPYLSKEDRFPYWFNEEMQWSSWHDPATDWQEQLAFSRRTLCHELGLDANDLVPRSTKGSSFRVAAKGVVAAQSLRRMSENYRSYSKDKAVPVKIIEQIDLDIPRTANGETELLACLGITRAVLLRHAAEDPALGYCQGMNMVAALFAVAAQSQAEAFTRFQGFIQSLRGLWEPGFPLLQQGISIFETLAAERPWFQHLQRNRVEPEMYLPRAWLGLFTSWLPLATRVLLLRSLEQGHLSSMLAISLAILDHVGSELLEQGDDMDDLLKVLDGIKDKPPHPAALITARDAWLPLVSATRVRRSGRARWWKALRRDGSRVLDHRGEALFKDHKECRQSLAAAGRALLKFCFGDSSRR